MDISDLEHIKKETSVSPIAKGGSNFEIQILYKVSNHKFQIKPTLGYSLFCGVFVLIPAVIIGFGIHKYLETGNFDFLIDEWFMVLWLILFSTATIKILINFFTPIVFDKSINRFYKGFHKDKTKIRKDLIRLSDIVAIQIIGEIIEDDDSKFNSFELNIVLSNTSRINITDHNNLKGIIADAETLSKFLDIPIWHAASNKT
ncbi:hypothetical protein [Psychroserpens luteolus]|uniref:hypothetical protein n=1 Tax=Psychroserpens luteolus TaxID=2855840 RepID=UPI001E621CAC|nr:hypothetical protein [Psychroserpens luteolus]MCD2259020.1 hypothetical protein [Psychroserpens luteolus]